MFERHGKRRRNFGVARVLVVWSARFTGLVVMSWSPWSCDQRHAGAARRPRVPGERPQTPTNLPRRAGGPRDLHVFGGVFRRRVRPRGGRSGGAVSARLHGVALAHPSVPYVSPLRRRPRLRQPARPSGCTSSSGRSSSDLQRGSLSPTVISGASSRFLIRSPMTRQTPPPIQGRQAGRPGRHHARLPSRRITQGTPDDPGDRRDEKQGGAGGRAAGLQQQAPLV